MPGPEDKVRKESTTLKPIYDKLQAAAPSEQAYSEFVANLKTNPAIDDQGHTYRDMVMGLLQQKYGETPTPEEFNTYVDAGIQEEEHLTGHPVFTSREEMTSYIDAQRKIKEQEAINNPMANIEIAPYEDHGGDPYMGYFPDGTPVDGTPAFDFSKFDLAKTGDSHQVFMDDVKRRQSAYPVGPSFPTAGAEMNNNIDFEQTNQMFSDWQHQQDAKLLGGVMYDIQQEWQNKDPEMYKEISGKLQEFMDAEDWDAVGVKDYLVKLMNDGKINPNTTNFGMLISQGNAADPKIKKQKSDRMNAYEASADRLIEDRDKNIARAKRLRELDEIEDEIFGGVEMSYMEKKLMGEELYDVNSRVNRDQARLLKIREESGNPTLGMTPEDKSKYKAEQDVIKSYKKEWKDVLNLYDISPYNSDRMKDLKFKEEVGVSIEQSLGEYLQEMEGIDYDEFVRMSGKSKQDLLKDYAYRKFWPEFKQMVRNYDPSTLTGIIGNVAGDWSSGANIADVYQVLDRDPDEVDPNTTFGADYDRKVSEIASTGGEPEEAYVRDMIEKAVLLYYMAEEGKDPTTFFGQGDDVVDDPGVLGEIANKAVGTYKSVLRGGHEMSMGAMDLVGLEGTKTAGATIRDDLTRKSVVSDGVITVLNNAGLETPENILSWAKPSAWERIQNITTDVSRLGSEFLVTEIATGGLGTPGALAKLGEGINVMAKGSVLARTGLRTEAALTRLAGELGTQVKMLETLGTTARNPMTRFWAKRALQGGNALREGVKYELVGRAFKDDAIDFESGVAGYYGKALINSFFPTLPKGSIKSKIVNFFGKGTGEMSQETFQEISQQGWKKFMSSMSDPEELTWFLGASFVLGGAMGGSDSKMQDWALIEYNKMTPKQKTRFDNITGRLEFKEYADKFQARESMSDFGKEIQDRLTTTPNRMTEEQRLSIENDTDAETERQMSGFDFDVNDDIRTSIKAKNRELTMSGQDVMSMDGMVEELGTPVDVSSNYTSEMDSEARTNQIIEDIHSAGYQNNNVYDQIKSLPDGPDKSFLESEFRAAESSRKKMFDKMLGKIDEEITPVDLNIDPTQAQSRTDRILSKFNPIRQAVQDKHVYLKRFTDRVKKAGGIVTDATNTYDLFSLASGKLSFEGKKLITKILNPDIEGSIANRVQNVKGKVGEKEIKGDENEFGKLLYALNAKEKNAQLRKKHGADTDKDSGMTDQESDTFVQKMKDEGKYDQYMEIEKDFRAQVIDPILDEKLDNGFITQDDYDAMKETYDYYVPTKVNSEKLGYENASYLNSGPGFVSKGIKTLEGSKNIRYDDRFNPFYRAAQDRMIGLISMERNKSAQSFANLIRNNGLDKGNGAKFKFTDKAGPNTVDFYEDGAQVHLEIKDPKILEAVRNVDIRDPYVSAVINSIGVITKLKRYTSTTRNPGFVIPNFIRDYGSGFMRLQALGIDASFVEYNKSLKKALGGFKKASKDIEAGKTPTTEFGKMLQEMYEEGAVTTYASDFANVDSKLNDLEKKMADLKKGKFKNTPLKDFLLLKWVEDISEVGEIGVRAAVYDLGKKQGMSKQQAAVAAREVTMNFDRKGKMSYITNTLWMFSNAGIQGSYNLAKTLQTSKKARAMAIGTFTTAIGVRMLNAMLAQDEDEEDAIYEFDKERSMTFLNPFSDTKGDYIKIPVPQGLDMIKYMGDITYDIFTDKMDAGEAIGATLKKLSSTINPLDSPSFAQTVMPTLLDPFIQHTTNENYFGGQLYPESKFGGEKVMAYEKFKNASVVGTTIAEGMNYLSGGSKVERGMIDFSPNVWDNYFNFIAGGSGRFYAESMLAVSDMVNGDFDMEKTKIPVFSSFHRTGKMNADTKTKMYEMKNASTVTKMSPDDFNNFQGLLTKLVETGEIEPRKADRMLKEVYRNQQYVKFASEHDMTVPEAKDFMKGK